MNGEYSEEYIEERPAKATETKKETHAVGVAPHMAPSAPVRRVRVLANADVDPEYDRLMKRLKLYSHTTIYVVGLATGLILGVLL